VAANHTGRLPVCANPEGIGIFDFKQISQFIEPISDFCVVDGDRRLLLKAVNR